MESKRLPFNIFLLDSSKSRLSNLLPVETQDIYGRNEEFNVQGLYSTEIFGVQGSQQRIRKHSYIDMRVEIMHPKVYYDLVRLKGMYGGIMAGTTYAVWDDNLKDFVASNIIDGETGYSFFISHFRDIVFVQNESALRELRIKFINKVKDRCMYRYLVVLPAGLREIEISPTGQTTEDDINGMYRKIIRIASLIPTTAGSSNNPMNTIYDTSKWSLQKGFLEIYDYILSILNGKHGFLLAKVAARQVQNGTRNIITNNNPAPKLLGSIEAITVNDTACGLYQYLKGTAELSIYNIKNGPLSNIINSLPNDIQAVNPKTLNSITITPSKYAIDLWGSTDGIGKLINSYGKIDKRSKPIMIDGNYAALIYIDGESYKVLYDINELPSNFDRNKVYPLTFAVMLYLSVYAQSLKVIGYVTRYPITGTDSIYPSNIYLQTTTASTSLQGLGDDWKPDLSIPRAINFPDRAVTLNGDNGPKQSTVSYYDSMSVHISKYVGLSCDTDGDEDVTLA